MKVFDKFVCKLDNKIYRVFSRDVTASMIMPLNKGTAAMLVSLLILRELNSILMQTLSFVLVEKHAHSSRE